MAGTGSEAGTGTEMPTAASLGSEEEMEEVTEMDLEEAMGMDLEEGTTMGSVEETATHLEMETVASMVVTGSPEEMAEVMAVETDSVEETVAMTDSEARQVLAAEVASANR